MKNFSFIDLLREESVGDINLSFNSLKNSFSYFKNLWNNLLVVLFFFFNPFRREIVESVDVKNVSLNSIRNSFSYLLVSFIKLLKEKFVE